MKHPVITDHERILKLHFDIIIQKTACQCKRPYAVIRAYHCLPVSITICACLLMPITDLYLIRAAWCFVHILTRHLPDSLCHSFLRQPVISQDFLIIMAAAAKCIFNPHHLHGQGVFT